MTTKDEALKLALEALEWAVAADTFALNKINNAITAIKESLAQPEQEPVAWLVEGLNDGKLISHQLFFKLNEAQGLASWFAKHYPTTNVKPLYTTTPQRKQLTEAQAHDMGAKGGEPTEAERLLFEAWMRGHCWAVIGDWDGKTYIHVDESNGFVHGGAMATRQLWAAWRDRAALEAAHGITGESK